MKQLSSIALFFLLLMSGVFAQGQQPEVGQNIGSLIYLDGVNIPHKADIQLKKDQLLLLETFDLMPNSSVQVRARGGGGFEGNFTTDDNGAIHEILFFPKNRSKIKCTMHYTTKNGKNRKHDFSLNPVQ